MKTKLNVSGMHCKSCETLIKEDLEELEGVKEAKADSKKGVVEIDYDEKKTNINMIKNVITKGGYKVERD